MTSFRIFLATGRQLLLAFGVFAILGLGNIDAADEQFLPRDLRACTTDDAVTGYDMLCKEALTAERAAHELNKLKTTRFSYELHGDALVVTVRMTAAEAYYPDGPYLCCEIQAYLNKISDEVYSASFRWERMADAMLDLQFLGVKNRPDARLKLNGSPSFVFADNNADESMIARTGAQMVTSTYPAGGMLGPRKISVFRGAQCLKKVAKCSVIYMPDGQYVRMFVTNSLLNKIDMTQFVVVGVHNADQDSNGSRIEELLFGYNKARFEAFMSLVTHDVRELIEHGERPLHRYAAGLSNGGSWAYNALATQNGGFDGAVIMSPGERATQSEDALPGRVVFIGAGYMESKFYKNTSKIATDLKSRGALVNEVYVPSGHGMNTWVNIWNAAINQLNAEASAAQNQAVGIAKTF
jgi:predicted esterase